MALTNLAAGARGRVRVGPREALEQAVDGDVRGRDGEDAAAAEQHQPPHLLRSFFNTARRTGY